MSDQTQNNTESLFQVLELRPQGLEAHAHLWQFEPWLPRMVYVQLRALDGDARESEFNTGNAKKPKGDVDLTVPSPPRHIPDDAPAPCFTYGSR